MSATPLTPVPELDRLLHDILGSVRTILAQRFVGMYLDGSLATGEIPAASVEALRAMHAALPTRAPRWGLELEVSYVPCEALRHHDPRPAAHPHVERGSAALALVHPITGYWVIHRHVVREHGVTVAGPEPRTLIDPVDPDQLRAAVAGLLREWWAPMVVDGRRLENSFYRCYEC